MALRPTSSRVASSTIKQTKLKARKAAALLLLAEVQKEFQHHDALADADACARIVIHMAARHEVESLEDLLLKTSQRLATVVV